MTDEVRDMIGKALANEPPLGIDYDTVHAAGRRRLARRHVGIIGGTALAVIAVASAAVAVGQLNASPANGPAVPPPSTSTTPAPAPPQGCVVPAYTGGFTSTPDGVATAAELAESARLSEAFARFVLPLPPGVSTDPAKLRLCAVNESWGTEFPLRFPDGERAVFLEVLPRAGQAPGECGTRRAEETCVTTQRPDGSVVKISETPAAGPDHPVLVNVMAWRADDTIVRILETGTTGPQPKTRILDDQALTAIATAPELKINWGAPSLPRAAEPSDRRAAELSTLVPLPAGMRAEEVPHARADAMAFYVSQGGYKLNADLVDVDGEGNLFINLNPPVPGVPPKPQCDAQVGCELIRLSDGRTATLTRQQDGEITTLMLNTTAPDGTQVTIMSRNMSARSEAQAKNVRPGKATRTQPPLDAEALIRIASDPGLRW